MATVKAAEANAIAARADGRIAAILVYGADAGAVHDLSARLVKTHAGESGDPFGLVRIDDQELVKDPARLPDEMSSISLLGGRRTIWISGAGAGLVKAVELLRNPQPSGNLIIAEGTNYIKTHKLRTAFEAGKSLAIVACYEDSDEDLRLLSQRLLKQHGLAIAEDALELLVANLGADRLLSRSEIEKLALYAEGEQMVTAAMVSAVCGDASSAGTDELVDAAFDGMAAETLRLFSKLLAEGQDPSRLVGAAASHLAILQRQKMTLGDSGRSSYLPQFRQAAIQRQARQWSAERLADLGTQLSKAVFSCRTEPQLADAIASRTMLAIAWAARAPVSAARPA